MERVHAPGAVASNAVLRIDIRAGDATGWRRATRLLPSEFDLAPVAFVRLGQAFSPTAELHA